MLAKSAGIESPATPGVPQFAHLRTNSWRHGLNKHILSLLSHSYKNMPLLEKRENEKFLMQPLSKEVFHILIKYIILNY